MIRTSHLYYRKVSLIWDLRPENHVERRKISNLKSHLKRLKSPPETEFGIRWAQNLISLFRNLNLNMLVEFFKISKKIPFLFFTVCIKIPKLIPDTSQCSRALPAFHYFTCNYAINYKLINYHKLVNYGGLCP